MEKNLFVKHIYQRLQKNGAVRLSKSEIDFIGSLFVQTKRKNKRSRPRAQLFKRIANRIKRGVRFHLWREEFFLLTSLFKRNNYNESKREKPLNKSRAGLVTALGLLFGFSLIGLSTV